MCKQAQALSLSTAPTAPKSLSPPGVARAVYSDKPNAKDGGKGGYSFRPEVNVGDDRLRCVLLPDLVIRRQTWPGLFLVALRSKYTDSSRRCQLGAGAKERGGRLIFWQILLSAG